MSEIKWDDQVQVQILEPIGIENYQVVKESVVKWDGIDFAEAVKRCMTLSPEERAEASILAPSGHYGRKEIEALCIVCQQIQRRDDPRGMELRPRNKR